MSTWLAFHFDVTEYSKALGLHRYKTAKSPYPLVVMSKPVQTCLMFYKRVMPFTTYTANTFSSNQPTYTQLLM